MYELASMGDLPLPQSSPSPSNKRDRDSDSPIDANSPQMPPTPASMATPSRSPSYAPSPSERQFAGSRRVTQQQQQQQQPQSHPPPLQSYQPAPPQQHSLLSTTHQPAPPQRRQPPTVDPPQMPSQGPVHFSPPVPPATASGMASSVNYGLPMYTADLGRMPLHPGNTADPFTTMSWRDMAALSGAVPMTATAAAASNGGYQANADPLLNNDPKIPSMFAASSSAMPPVIPGSYEQVMSTMTGAPLGTTLDGYPNVLEAGMSEADMGGGSGIMGSGMLGMGMGDPTGGVFTDSDTLAMWSNAPQGFE